MHCFRMLVILFMLIFAMTTSAEIRNKFIKDITEAVTKICATPTAIGNHVTVEGEGEAGVIVKLVGINASAQFTRERWKGIRQTVYIGNSIECGVKLTPIFIEKFSPDPDDTPKRCSVIQKNTDVYLRNEAGNYILSMRQSIPLLFMWKMWEWETSTINFPRVGDGKPIKLRFIGFEKYLEHGETIKIMTTEREDFSDGRRYDLLTLYTTSTLAYYRDLSESSHKSTHQKWIIKKVGGKGEEKIKCGDSVYFESYEFSKIKISTEGKWLGLSRKKQYWSIIEAN